MKTTKRICVTAVGIALFVVLALCLQVPVFENYYLCLGYVAVAFYCWFLGPVSGMLVGSLGVVLYCLLISGLRGMPGWFLGNLVIGLGLGVTCRFAQKLSSRTIQQVLIAITVVVTTAVGILGVKSITECVLYAQPFLIRAAKNIYAFVADTVVLVVSFPICLALEGAVFKIFPELRGGKSA